MARAALFGQPSENAMSKFVRPAKLIHCSVKFRKIIAIVHNAARRHPNTHTICSTNPLHLYISQEREKREVENNLSP
jgi:hypothetical protein